MILNTYIDRTMRAFREWVRALGDADWRTWDVLAEIANEIVQGCHKSAERVLCVEAVVSEIESKYKTGKCQPVIDGLGLLWQAVR
jgi:hypothetical protein